MRMKILHVAPFYAPTVGGAQVHIQELSEQLALRGHQVTVLTANVSNFWDMEPRRGAGLPSVEVMNGVTIMRVNPRNGAIGKLFDGVLKLKGGYRSLSTVLGQERLDLLVQGHRMFPTIKHLLALDADIITTINWYCAPAFYVHLARKFKRFKTVGIPLFHTADMWAHRRIFTSMLRSCDALLANTEHEAEFIKTRGGRRVEVAGVGIHPTAFEGRDGSAIRKQYGLGAFPVVGFVGRLVPYKGATTLLHAMRVVWDKQPNVRLVLAGSIPPGVSDVQQLLQQFSPEERPRVLQIGEFAEAEKCSLYDCFDIFALPSTSESFGIGYLEAWLCGKPVIGARIGSTNLVIQDGIDGLLVKPDDPDDLASAILDLLSDPAKRQRMGQNGRSKTLAQFTWPKVTDKVEQVYRELLAAKPHGVLQPSKSLRYS